MVVWFLWIINNSQFSFEKLRALIHSQSTPEFISLAVCSCLEKKREILFDQKQRAARCYQFCPTPYSICSKEKKIEQGNCVVLKRYTMNDLMTKSFTSYVDLKKNAMKDLEAGPDYNDDVELTATKMDPHLSQFLEEAEKVKEEMGTIRDILGRLQEANEESKSLHKPDSLKSLRDRINDDIMGVLKKARTIRSRIEDMDRTNAENRRLSAGGYKSGTPIDRARTSVTNGLRKKLKELMMDFQGLRQKIMAEHREMVGRRYFTVTGEQPEEDVIEKIISNGGEDFMLQRAVVDEQGRGKVLETVVEIKDRHAAAKEIEKSLLELHQVFLDMAVMVEAQGEQMDDIEHHVFNAAHYVKDGTKNLNTAKGYQRSSRKWMCLGIILLLILILVIVIPIATSFSKS